MEQALTKEQKDLVELNHNLIYGFAKEKNLPIDEYYDILAIGLCKAARIYDKNKGSFSTLAYNCMRNELYIVYRHDYQRESAIPHELIYSYDLANEDLDNEKSIIEILTDNYSTTEVVINNIMLETFIDTLSEKEKKIFQLLRNEKTQEEISKEMNCARTNITYFVQRIRKKWIDFSA